MVRWILNLIYLGLLAMFSPLLIYRAWRHAKYRDGWGEKLLGRTPRRNPASKTVVWLHAVSMGEVHLLEPLIRQLEQRYPEWECVVSTTTSTGAQAAARKFPHLQRFYCPLDFSWAVDEAIRRIQPDVLVLSELEVWPNLINSVKRAGAKVAIVNGRLGDKSFRGYRRLSGVLCRVFGQLDLVCAQNAAYADRFVQLGVAESAVQVTGSMKFDGAVTDRGNAATAALRDLAGVDDDQTVFLAGSTQAPEERYSVESFLSHADSYPKLQLFIAPRHPERFGEVAQMLDQMGVAYRRRSQLEIDGGDSDCRILLLDVMGELRAWWGMCDIAYVGGSMGKREGQNMIEPSAYGAAVSFGPRTANFRDIVQLLLDAEAATVVCDSAELTEFVEHCLQHPDCAAEQGDRARRVVQGQLGAAAETAELLRSCLASPKAVPARAA